MIAARWGMLLVAALSILAASGATSAHGQPSSLRVEVAAVIGVLAPLFWPGRAATSSRTSLRVVAWSAAVTAAAAIALLVFPAQRWADVASTCAVLMAILVVSHAAAAALERRSNAPTGDAGSRELAGRAVASALAALGTLPFWLGPAAESLSARHAGIIDVVVGLSPVTHLAVASGNDLLHDSWLYEHSNLAVLPVAYPALGTVAAGYAAVCAVLAIAMLASRRPSRPSSPLATDLTQEQSR